MKGIICYFSLTGNTKLSCEYIKKHIKNCDFELYDMTKKMIPNFKWYDIVGFATYCDYFDVPQYIINYFDRMQCQNGKYAFVFNTYGSFSMRTLKTMKQLAESKGFNILAGHSLRTPENYPPLRKNCFKADDHPKSRELEKFDQFIYGLDNIIKEISFDNIPEPTKIHVGLGNIVPKLPHKSSKWTMGEQCVDESICIKCGLCEKKCAYGAIKLTPFPVIEHDKCYGCWACYNICPKQAIYTKKLRDIGHYKKPNRHMLDTLDEKD